LINVPKIQDFYYQPRIGGNHILSSFPKPQPNLPTCYFATQSLHATMKLTFTLLALLTVALALPTKSKSKDTVS
jgi:hypothetical protein